MPDCFIPAPDSLTCLYNQATTDVLFDQLESYGGPALSTFLSVCAMACLIVYFVSSSDSGSFVIDMMAANGILDPPVGQRVFWAITEGATAVALLVSGSNQDDNDGALKALQAISIIMGLPYTFVLFWCCQALLQVAAEEAGEVAKDGPKFSSRLFLQKPAMLVKNTLVPFLDMGNLADVNGNWPFKFEGKKIWTGIFGLQWLCMVVALILAAVDYQFIGVGFSLYTLFAVFIAILRRDLRATSGIQTGGMFSDFTCAFFMPMFAVSQLKTHVDATGGKPAKGENGRSAQGPVDEKPSPNEEAEMEVDC
jgi:hypothetical protein